MVHFYEWLNLAFCSSIDYYLCLKHSSIDFFAYGMDEGFYLLSTAFVHRFLHLRYGRIFLFIVHCMDEYALGLSLLKVDFSSSFALDEQAFA